MKKLFVDVLIFIALVLLAGCATTTTISKTHLSTAAANGNINAVNDLLAKGANACEKGEYGITALGWAFTGESGLGANTCGNELYRILMENAYDIFNKGGQCPNLWMYAVAGGCNDIVKKLLEKGSNPDDKFNEYFTALGVAAYYGQLETAKILINKGVDWDSAIYGLKKYALAFPSTRQANDANLGVEILNGFKSKQVDPTTIIATGTASAPVLEKPIIKSDIDELPAIKVKHNKNAYAIVIGIENYRQKLPKADFATQDARLVADYLIKAMGYPEENVVTLTNEHATKGDFEKYFERWLINNIEKDNTVFVYFSGHGAPNTKTGDAYLVPYDGDPTFIVETGYSIARLYESLGKLKAKEITVVLDSCFSGAGGRSVLAKGAKPLVMTINMPTMRKNISVMTASSGDQISSAYEEQGHGLFTYFLLKGIKDEDVVRQDGSIKMDDLFDYIKPQVERIARKQFNNEQTPQLIGAKKN